MTRFLLLTSLLLSLSGCKIESLWSEDEDTFKDIRIVDKAPTCYEIFNEKRSSSSVLLNKCTGESWLMTEVVVQKGTKDSKAIFTYRWSPISKEYAESHLSRGF